MEESKLKILCARHFLVIVFILLPFVEKQYILFMKQIKCVYVCSYVRIFLGFCAWNKLLWCYAIPYARLVIFNYKTVNSKSPKRHFPKTDLSKHSNETFLLRYFMRKRTMYVQILSDMTGQKAIKYLRSSMLRAYCDLGSLVCRPRSEVI